MFGVVSHDIADILWHGLNNEEEGFIRAISFGSMDGQYALAHAHTDAGAEAVIKHSSDMSYIKVAIGVKTLGSSVFAKYSHTSPILVEQVENYYRGGLVDMAAWVPFCWKELIRWIDEEVPLSDGQRFCELLVEYQGDFKYNRAVDQSVEYPFKGGHGADLVSFGPELPGYGKSPAEVSDIGNDLVFKPPRTTKLSKRSEPQPTLTKRGLLEWANLKTKCEKLNSVFKNVATLTTTVPYAGLGTALVKGYFNGPNRPILAISAPYHKHGVVRGAVFLIRPEDLKQSDEKTQDITEVAFQMLLGDSRKNIPVRFGETLAVLDYNQDGIDDLVVGVPAEGAYELTFHGEIRIFLGTGQGVHPNPRYILRLPKAYSYNTMLGNVLSVADVNGDGKLDLLVGAPMHGLEVRGDGNSASNPQAGGVFVYLSKPRDQLAQPQSQGVLFDHYLPNPQPTPYQWFGKSMSVGYVDRQPMLVVGAPGYKGANNTSMAGKIYGFQLPLGQQSQLTFTILGNSKFQQVGHAVEFARSKTHGSILVISAPSQTIKDKRHRLTIHPVDSLLNAPTGWQKGSVHFMALNRQNLRWNMPLESYAYQFGEDDGSHFGWSLSVIPTRTTTTVLAGEPFTDSEEGRLYAFDVDNPSELRCYRSTVDVKHQRFGSNILVGDFNRDGNMDYIITSEHTSISARSSGMVQVTLS
ncbi:Glycosylphosphatidylinositol specific phospholipase D1 [Dispira simplex]|nr:Glycosylphosphatidylinositol specific phospholipase D1 [Dispira simplex]